MKENEQKISHIKERILEFIEYKEFSRREFCKLIAINPLQSCFLFCCHKLYFI